VLLPDSVQYSKADACLPRISFCCLYQPAMLAGKDVLGTVHNGSGKTAAFALLILQKLAKDPFRVYALVSS